MPYDVLLFLCMIWGFNHIKHSCLEYFFLFPYAKGFQAPLIYLFEMRSMFLAFIVMILCCSTLELFSK